MYKRLLLLITLVVSLYILSGCWNYNDIDSLSIVAGFALDKDSENNMYKITAEIINIEESGSNSKVEPKLVESEGRTYFEAIRNMINLTGKKLYWSHAKVMIINKEIAKEGLLPIMDFFQRDSELRTSIFILVSKEKTANEILKQTSITSKIRSFEIETMLEEYKTQASIEQKDLNKFIISYTTDGINGTIPAIKIVNNNDSKTSKISGISIFKKDKLMGFLNGEQTEQFNFIKNNIVYGLYIIQLPDEKYITLEIFKNQTEIKPHYENDKFKVTIDIKTEVFLSEVGDSKNILDLKGREKVQKIAKKQLESQIKNLIQEVQSEYGTDIFGFGNIIKAKFPNVWRSKIKEWDNEFIKLEVEVNSKFEIINSVLTREEIKEDN